MDEVSFHLSGISKTGEKTCIKFELYLIRTSLLGAKNMITTQSTAYIDFIHEFMANGTVLLANSLSNERS